MSAPADKPKIKSTRQSEVLTLVEQGLSNAEIAEAINRSPFTVKVTLQRIYKILGVKNRRAAVIAWRANAKQKILTLEALRESRRENEANILALQKLVKLQTEAIEMMLQQD